MPFAAVGKYVTYLHKPRWLQEPRHVGGVNWQTVTFVPLPTYFLNVTAQASPCNVGAALTGNRPCSAAAREVAAALVRIPTGPLQGDALQLSPGAAAAARVASRHDGTSGGEEAIAVSMVLEQQMLRRERPAASLAPLPLACTWGTRACLPPPVAARSPSPTPLDGGALSDSPAVMGEAADLKAAMLMSAAEAEATEALGSQESAAVAESEAAAVAAESEETAVAMASSVEAAAVIESLEAAEAVAAVEEAEGA